MIKWQTCTHVLKVEAVRLLERLDKPEADVARELGICRNQHYEGSIRVRLDLLPPKTNRVPRRHTLPGVLPSGTTGMRALVVLVVALSLGTSTGCTRQAQVAARGAQVMPFDLEQTIHVFQRLDDGGRQTVTVKDPSNEKQIALIQPHLLHEGNKFRRGDFSDPARIHGDDMPGLAELRTVDLSPGLIETLESYLTWCKAEALAKATEASEATREKGKTRQAPSPWLFSNTEGQPLDEAKTRKVFKHALEKIGLPTSFVPYDLRHTFASILLSDGVPLLYVSKQLGHSKPDTTLRYYAHWIPDAGEHFVNQLDLGKVGTKLAPNTENEAPTEETPTVQAPEINVGAQVIEISIGVGVDFFPFERFHEAFTTGVVVGVRRPAHARKQVATRAW